MRLTNIRQKSEVLKLHFIREWGLAYLNSIDFLNNIRITNVELTFDYPYNPPSRMFTGCTNLTDLLINGNIYPSESNEYGAMFSRCSHLANLSITTISGTLYLNDCKSLTQESVNNVLNALADGVTDKSITFASTQYNYITEEQKAAATAKGWTIKSA